MRTDGQTDGGRTDLKLIVVFRNFAKAPTMVSGDAEGSTRETGSV